MTNPNHLQIKQLDNKSYKNIVQSHPEATWPIEQTFDWGQFQNELGGRQHLGNFGLYLADKLVATTSLLQLDMRGYSYVWVNNGPTILDAKLDLNLLINTLKQLAQEKSKTQKPLFIRFNLPDPDTTKGLSQLQPAYSHSLLEKTTVINLEKDEEEIYANMKQGARRAIRKAIKANITVKCFSGKQAMAEFTPLYDILRETSSRDGFHGHPKSAYEAMLTQLDALALLYVAYNEANQPIAWAIVTAYQSNAIYYYGASNAEARKTMAPYLMHWQIIKDMKMTGNKSYDFLGIGSNKYPGLEGVTQFKLKFGGPVVDYTPIYDLPLNPIKYRAWRLAQKLRYRLKS